MHSPNNLPEVFKTLDREFENDPQRFLDRDGRMSCTQVGEYLVDEIGLEPEDAFEKAFDWAEQPQYEHLRND